MTQPRDETIDSLKGMLVFGMILSHVAGLISSHSDGAIKLVWLITGLVTFSGFMFSFGYACQLAYFSKTRSLVAQRMLITALKPLIAFYLSGIYWRAFVDQNLTVKGILKILLLRDIPPFSEFLIAFALIMLVSLFLFRPIQHIVAHPSTFWLSFTLLLFTTFLPYDWIQFSPLALLIGTTAFPTFPVLQYFPVFLLGAYFAKHRLKRDRTVQLVALSGLVAFVGFYAIHHQLPSRFPPSCLWILASIALVDGYYQIAQRLPSPHPLTTLLRLWGKNVLFYLLISNILIFTFRGAYAPLDLNLFASVGLTLLLLFTLTFFTTIVVPQPRAIAPAPSAARPDSLLSSSR